MNKILKYLTFTFLFIGGSNCLNHYASITCSTSFCKIALEPCLKCYGITQCKKCILSIEQQCFPCVNEIYTPKSIIIGKSEYQMCSGINQLDNKICHLYCRGDFYYTGACTVLNDFLVCQCSDISSPYPPTTSSFTQNLSIKIHQNYLISPKEESLKIKGLANGNIAFGNSDVFILNAYKDKIVYNLSTSLYSIKALETQMNGNLLTLSKFDNFMSVWKFDESNESLVTFNQTGSCLKALKNNDLAICQDSEIKVIDGLDGTEKFSLIGHEDFINCVAVLEYDEIASGSRDGSIKIWNYKDGSLKKEFNSSNSSVISLTVLNNGNLVSGHLDGIIKVWTHSGDLSLKISAHLHAVSCLTSLNSRYLVSGSFDRYFKIWDLNEQSEKFSFKSRPVYGVEYFGNGFLAVSSHSQINIWEVYF